MEIPQWRSSAFAQHTEEIVKSFVAALIALVALPAIAQNRTVKPNFIGGYIPTCASFINYLEAPSNPVIAGEPFTLTAHAGSFGNLTENSYQWFRGSVGDESSGVIGVGSSITVSEKDTSTYWVRVTASCGQPVTAQATVRLNKGTCAEHADQLCLDATRYRVTLEATDTNGNKASGVALYETNTFGYFSLPAFTGDAAVPEVMVKVLGPVNDVPWVFYSGLTNLDYRITVTDTTTGKEFKTYHVAAPQVGSEQSFGNYDVNGFSSQQCDNVVVQTAIAASPGACRNGDGSLCLLDRFLITMKAHDNPVRSERAGDGVALPATKGFGFFSVPALSGDRSNIESFVKMIDATPTFGHYWLFLGGLTDFEFTVTATDTVTGLQKIYTKPAGSTCGINDTLAF